MGSLTLLEHARAAGLVVRADGDRIVVRGPSTAAALAQQLLARKHEILPLLVEAAPDAPADLYLDPLDRRVVEAIRTGDTFVLRPIDAAESSPDIPAGWTRASWIDRLRYMATACEPYVPERAAELRAWADRIDKTTSANKEGAA